MRKVITKKTFNKSPKTKLVAYLTALTLGISSLSFPVYAKNTENIEISYLNYDERLSALNLLYQEQMNYIYETITELKEFYTEKDTKDIIKNAYPEAYHTLKHNFNTEIISYGNSYNFIPNIDLKDSKAYVELIKGNNKLISSLKIKPAGNGREPDYGIIKDESKPYGFRRKTEEDKKLIDEYTKLLNNPIIINDNLLNLLSLDIEDITKEDLIIALESIINDQIIYIKQTQNKLTTFYSNVDTKDIIKTAYNDAYNIVNIEVESTYFEMKNSNLTQTELINSYLKLIKENNKLISSLKIKPAGNGREPDYGIIKDETKPNGFRRKTDEDQKLIDKYTSIVGNINYLPFEIIEYLEIIKNEKTNAMVKKYENR